MLRSSSSSNNNESTVHVVILSVFHFGMDFVVGLQVYGGFLP
jgi:hypothetical protein